MIAFFPEIYPDELLYSQLARYHSRSGYARYVYTVTDIYNNQTLVHPNVDFVNRYTPDAMQWITKKAPWETVAEQYTMYPAYIRFLPKLQRIEAVKGILSCEGNWKNLMRMPKLGYTRYIRYCPECAKEDREKHGETYWHREHQIPRIRVCPRHRCFLENSEIAISAKTSPGLYDAESNVPDNTKPRMCCSEREIAFTQYVIDVMHEQIDLENPLPVGKFLHSRLSSDYVNDSGLVRNVSKLYEDYLSFYGDNIPTMEISYLRKIFNGYHHDTFFVLQLAYFEGITVQEVTHLPNDIPLYGLDAIYQALSHRYQLDYAVVEAIGLAVLKYTNNQTHVSRQPGKRRARYDEMDTQYLPQVKSVIQQILGHGSRPEKVSFAKVQKALGLPQKQIDKLPKCKAYITKHIEPQPVYWAREVEWAITELMQEGKPVNTSQIMKKTNMRIRDIQCCCPYIKNPDVKSLISSILSSCVVQPW